MTNINLRLYGEQIYPNISKYLSTYISPEIQKENFLEMYKNGNIEYNQISIKEKIIFNPQISIENASLEDIKLHIPNEQDNFSLYLNNVKCLLILSNIKEEEIEKILIDKKKELINDFIKYAIDKIEKKDGPSFIDNLLKNFIDKIINGLSLEINNLELKIKLNDENNKDFIILIENINYIDNQGIKIKNISILYEENDIKINVLNKFDFNIDIIHFIEEGKLNQFILNISDIKLELNENIYYEFLNYYNLFKNADYKKTYIIYKKLIQFHKPVPQDGKKNYKFLWYYAIRTVIKLNKYIKSNRQDIFDLFDLLESSQMKIIKNFLKEDKETANFLLPDDKNYLKATKEKVEKKVLENKKGNVLANAFNFFFGAKKEEEKQLTEEEKETSEEIYKESNIINYINGNIKNNNNIGFSSIKDNIIKFFKKSLVNINISKLELILYNKCEGKRQNIFIKGMALFSSYKNEEMEINYIINDIGYDQNKSFFIKNDQNVNAIEISRNKNNYVSLSFGFNIVELNEEFFLSFVDSLKTKKKNKSKKNQIIFHRKKYINIIDKKDEENKFLMNLRNFSLMNNFKISNIPSFSIITIDNKFEINIVNYSLAENSFKFTFNIKDKYGPIINDFTVNPKKENNNFIFHPSTHMNITLSNNSAKSLLLNYLRYKKFKRKKKGRNVNKNNSNLNISNNELFNFDYDIEKNIDLSSIDMNAYIVDILIIRINIQIEEKEDNFKSYISINNFKLNYINKNLNISFNNGIITSNLASNLTLFIFRKGLPILEECKKILNKENENNENKEIDNSSENINEKKKFKKNRINFTKLFNEIVNELNFQFKSFSYILYCNNIILSLNLLDGHFSKTKEQSCINLYFENWYGEINSPTSNYNNKKIIENHKKSLLIYDLNTDLIKGEIKSLYLYTNLIEMDLILDNISPLFDDDNEITFKISFNIDDIVLSSSRFIYYFSKIYVKNFKEKMMVYNIFYFKIFDFYMRNNDNIPIIHEKEFDLDYILTANKVHDIKVKCNNVYAKISQNDISYILINFRLPEENEENLKKFNSMPKGTKTDYNISSKEKYEDIKDNEYNLQKKFSMLEFQNEIRKKFTITANINIPKLNLCFCLNENYNKVGEFSVTNSQIKIKWITNEDMFNKRKWTDIIYGLLLNKLNLKYFNQDHNTEYIILSKRQIYENDNKFIEVENEDEDENQIEIISENDDYTININKNEVNVRFDSLLTLYFYFKGAIPIEELLDNFEQFKNKNKHLKRKSFNIRINFNKSQFQLDTSLDNNENLYLDINKFIIRYNNLGGETPYGEYNIELNQLLTNIVSKNNIRKLFFTEKKFLTIQINYTEEIFSWNVLIGILKINLSYKDLICFLKVYLLSLKMFDKISKKSEFFLKNLELIKMQKENNDLKYNKIEDKNKIKDLDLINYLYKKNTFNLFTGELFFEKLDIILIDNSKGSYHPFMNVINEKIHLVSNPDKTIESQFSLVLYSYNYISCKWEPTIEKTKIEYKNSLIISQKKKFSENKINLVNNLSINLSDMAISFTLLTFNNWINKFEEEKKKFEENEEYLSNIIQTTGKKTKNISKITNNQLINYTGIEMSIIHNEQNIKCSPLQKIELDYINELNQSKMIKYIKLIYNEKQQFEIPLEKLVTLRHMIDNNLSIISENSLSENRTILISLYSPIIFKNKSIFPLQIKLKNYNYGKSFILNLFPNSIIGVPLFLINDSTLFNFKLINKSSSSNHPEEISDDFSQNYNISDILNTKTNQPYKKQIKFKNNYLIMNLDCKITNVRSLLINTEYSIVNCLPCDLNIYYLNKNEIIEKCTQYFIDYNLNSQSLFVFGIETSYGKFNTKKINFLSFKEKNKDNSIKFENKEKGLYFNLLFNFKQNEEENTLIIYAESILYNKSGRNISYSFENHSKLLCVGVSKNIHLLSSKINYKEENIQIVSNNFYSKEIKISQLIESSPYFRVELENYNNNIFNLNIKKKFSYISIHNNPNFKENIMSMVFNVLSTYRIINLLSTKKFMIYDYNNKKDFVEFFPLEKRPFYFFGKGINNLLGITVLNLNTDKYSHLIKFKFRIGIYTLSTNDFTFNIEIRKNPSNGCIDVFVIENNINNSYILLENLSNEGIIFYQKEYEENIQILQPNEKQPLKIYDYFSHDFIIQTGSSAKKIDLNDFEENGKINELNEKMILVIEANGIKSKATIYLTKEYQKLKSTLIFNIYILKINQIFISMIGDNEYPDTKLTNYKRNEIFLFYLSNLSISLNIEKTTGALNKDYIISNLNLNEFKIYNQISDEGKFSLVFNNTTQPFLSLNNEINFYQKLKIAKIENQKLKLGAIQLGIDPQFINEIFKFFDNILYRMNITNFNVHKLFLHQNKYNPEKLIKKYDNNDILINASELEYPELKLDFEISDIGLHELLKERIGCSDFYIWVAEGLIGRKQNLTLENVNLNFKNGKISQYLQYIYYNYINNIESRMTGIGFKAIFGKVKSFFPLVLLFDDDNNRKDYDVQKYRKRAPRAFYGKFKYFKEYDENDAILIRKTYRINSVLNNKYYPIKIIKEKNEFYLFTTLAMFKVNYSKFILLWNIDYFSVKKAYADEKKVKVSFNQIIDSKSNVWFECENEKIAQNIADCLNEEAINNKENLLEV